MEQTPFGCLVQFCLTTLSVSVHWLPQDGILTDTQKKLHYTFKVVSANSTGVLNI